MKKIERIGRMVLIVAVVTVGLLFWGPYKRFSVSVVLSGSMEPALKTGGLIFTDIKKVNPEKGDIITYCRDDMMITHRVSASGKNGYVTKGDANMSEDPGLVQPGQIQGTVVWSLPYLGYCAVFLKQKPVFCLIAIMLAQELFFLGIQWKD